MTYPVKITVEDTMTKETTEVEIRDEGEWYSWDEGNYACDCNRASHFNVTEKPPCGHSRFRIINGNGLSFCELDEQA